jgi:hypothetical protein
MPTCRNHSMRTTSRLTDRTGWTLSDASAWWAEKCKLQVAGQHVLQLDHLQRLPAFVSTIPAHTGCPHGSSCGTMLTDMTGIVSGAMLPAACILL